MEADLPTGKIPMTDCPKQQCIQDSRIATLEVRQGRAEADVKALTKCVKEIHAEVVGENGDGIRGRIIAIETRLDMKIRVGDRFWKIFGCAMGALAVIVAIVK